MKIVTVTMMKNEENIVESFIRHALFFSDQVIVFNHNSTDGTQKILDALANEFKERVIFCPCVYDTAMTINKEMFNYMIAYAFKELGADMVLPLDSDEFPVLLQGGNIRDYLEKLGQNQCYRVHFIPFSPTEKWRQDVFAPLLFHRRKKINMDTDYKVILTKKFCEENEVEVDLGNHRVFSVSSGQEVMVKDLYPELFYVHLPFRNSDHIESKLVVRWLSLIMRQDVVRGVAFQYQDGYEKILKGQVLSREEIDWFCMNNMLAGVNNVESLEDIQKVVEEESTRELFENVELRYTHLVQNKSKYVLLMELAQQIIDQYKDEKIKCEQSIKENKKLLYENENLKADRANLCSQMEYVSQINIQLEQQYRNLEHQYRNLEQHYLQMRQKYEEADQNLKDIKGSKAWKLIQLYRKIMGKHDPSQD